MKKSKVLFLALSLFTSIVHLACGEEIELFDKQGRSFHAVIQKVTKYDAHVIRSSDSKEFTLKLNTLAPETVKKLREFKAFQNLRKSTDEMKEIDWFSDKSTPESNNSRNVHAYIGKQKGRVWIRFKMTYNADDWLFVESVDFKVDGENFSLSTKLLDRWERDNSGGRIWEWKDMKMDRQTWNLITKIADSDKTIMRYNGDKYYSDREVTTREKEALKNILLAYELMGGEAPNDES